MKRNFIISILMTIVTTILLGLVYPLAVTGLAQLLFPKKANGQLIRRDGQVIGSRILAQPFTGAEYFHPRPSAAGSGYDAANSGASNLGPTNRKLIERVEHEVAAAEAENPGAAAPVDHVTTSASGLDPHITPANAEFQAACVARERGISEAQLLELVRQHTEGRQLGFLGEPRINVLELNLDLDAKYPLVKNAERSSITGD